MYSVASVRKRTPDAELVIVATVATVTSTVGTASADRGVGRRGDSSEAELGTDGSSASMSGQDDELISVGTVAALTAAAC